MPARPLSGTRRLAAPLLAVVVATAALAGCEGDSGAPSETADERPTPSPARSASSRQVAPSTPPAPTPPVTKPDADRDGQGIDVPQAGEPPSLEGLHSEDELEVARTMGDYYAWLMAHPDTDPELVENIFDEPRETGYEPTRLEIAREKVAQFREHRWWWTRESETRVVHVEVLDEQAPNIRVVRIYYHRPGEARLISTDGEVHEILPATRRFEEEIWTRDDGESPWQTINVMNTGEWQKGDI